MTSQNKKGKTRSTHPHPHPHPHPPSLCTCCTLLPPLLFCHQTDYSRIVCPSHFIPPSYFPPDYWTVPFPLRLGVPQQHSRVAEMTEADWFAAPDAHATLSGGELVKAAGRSDPYFPLCAATMEQPDVFVPPCPPRRRLCPSNHQPKSGDWTCGVCQHFNFWDHRTCVGCRKERPLQTLENGHLKEAVVSFYGQILPLCAGVTQSDLATLHSEHSVALAEPETKPAAGTGLGQPAAFQGSPATTLESHPGLGSSQSEVPADPYAAFRQRLSTRHMHETRQAEMLRRSGTAPSAGAITCYRCGREGHKAANCGGFSSSG